MQVDRRLTFVAPADPWICLVQYLYSALSLQVCFDALELTRLPSIPDYLPVFTTVGLSLQVRRVSACSQGQRAHICFDL